MTSVFCIVMAGGSGSRLWPVSRELFPKQMFKIDNELTLFQKTFLNIADFIDDKNIITATNIKYASSTKEQLKYLKEKFCRKNEYKIVTEPVSKNTAPCIALAVKYIQDKCVFSGSTSDIVAFSFSEGGFVSREYVTEETAQDLTPQQMKLIRYCFKSPNYSCIDTEKYSKADKQVLLSKLKQFIDDMSGAVIRSLDYLIK